MVNKCADTASETLRNAARFHRFYVRAFIGVRTKSLLISAGRFSEPTCSSNAVRAQRDSKGGIFLELLPYDAGSSYATMRQAPESRRFQDVDTDEARSDEHALRIDKPPDGGRWRERRSEREWTPTITFGTPITSWINQGEGRLFIEVMDHSDHTTLKRHSTICTRPFMMTDAGRPRDDR